MQQVRVGACYSFEKRVVGDDHGIGRTLLPRVPLAKEGSATGRLSSPSDGLLAPDEPCAHMSPQSSSARSRCVVAMSCLVHAPVSQRALELPRRTGLDRGFFSAASS